MTYLVATLACRIGAAAEYGGETNAATRDELAALAAAGELDAEGLMALQALLDEPPDPVHASPEALQLLPGVSRDEARRRVDAASGHDGDSAAESREDEAKEWLRFDAGAVGHLREVPAGFVRLRVTPSDALVGSLLAVTRERTRFGFSGERLVSDGPRREVGLERWHVAGKLGGWRLVVGNFNCDFAESLTFSSARRLYAPMLDAADAVVRAADAGGVRAVPALRGIALQLDMGVLEAAAFVSYRSLDLYQYGEWRRDDESPTVLQRGSGEPLRYATLTDAARERLVGANIDVHLGEHAIGVAAYAGAAVLRDPLGSWSVSSVYPVAMVGAAPSGSVFGAVGAHGVVQAGPVRARGEVARTLSGGLGAVARIDIALGDGCDVGLAGRVYGVAFDNPFARSFAEPDVHEGARARNERGLELSTALTVGKLLRGAASADVWTALTAPQVVNARARVRTTWRLTAREAVVLEGECVNKDLRQAGVYSGESCADPTAGDCARGARATGTARVITERLWKSRLALGVRHGRQDVAQGVAAESRVTGHLTMRPLERFTIGIVGTQRLGPRAPEIDGPRRLFAATVAAGFADWGSVEAMVRNEVRWDGASQEDAGMWSGALTFTVKL